MFTRAAAVVAVGVYPPTHLVLLPLPSFRGALLHRCRRGGTRLSAAFVNQTREELHDGTDIEQPPPSDFHGLRHLVRRRPLLDRPVRR